MPSKTLQKTETTTLPVAKNTALSRFDYPGEFAHIFNKPGGRLGDVDPTGDGVVRVRMEEEESGYQVLAGTSLARAFRTGCQFELTNHRDMSGKYALVSMQYNMCQSPSYVNEDSDGDPYQNDFVCIPVAVPYRPRRIAPKPVVRGPQTAVVTVKEGEESWLDKYGRVRVQFHWDRLGKSNEESACWVRVAQSWAGSGWGAHFWPRVGQEVVVEFLDGDPDQPLVTGSVYNASHMPPYPLPENYTRSGVKTRSSKEGNSGNYNEIRFEDKKGVEQVYVQAERDTDINVKHDRREITGNDRHLIVCHDQLDQVQGDKHLQVAGSKNEKIDTDRSLHVIGNRTESVDHEDSLTIGGTSSTKIKGELWVQVGGGHAEKIAGSYVLKAGRDIVFAPDANLIIDAGAGFCVRGPGGFMKIDAGGVTIQGVKLNLNSGGEPIATPFFPAMMDTALPVDPKNPDIADDGSHGGKSNVDAEGAGGPADTAPTHQ